MTKLEQVAKAILWKKSDSVTSQRLNMSLKEYKRLKEEVRSIQREENEAEDNFNELQKNGFAIGFSEDLDKGIAEYKVQSSFEPKTAEEIEKLIKLDKTKWKISRYSVWNGGKEDVWLTAVKVVAIEQVQDTNFLIEKTLTNYVSDYKPISIKDLKVNNNFNDKYCALIPMPDFHLDKLTINEIPIEQHIENYNKVLDGLIKKAYSSFRLNEIVFLVGNDFFHTDSLHNTTTKGTPLFVGTQWDNAYELGFDLMVKSISKLRQFCNKLNIILIPGNHSVTKEFYLAHALEVYFKPDKSIIFNRTKDDQKVYKYGETLLCFSHGNNINDKLPLVFATQFYKEWGMCRYHEIILGDKHYNHEKLFRSQNEANGVRMRIIPSLSGTDQWHKDNLFIGAIQAGICLIYSEKYGKCCEIEERI